MENIINSILENKELIFSGLTISLISILSNIFTRYLLTRKRSSTPRVTIKIKTKNGKEHVIKVSDYDSEEEVMNVIKTIKGNEFIKPNKGRQSDA